MFLYSSQWLSIQEMINQENAEINVIQLTFTLKDIMQLIRFKPNISMNYMNSNAFLGNQNNISK